MPFVVFVPATWSSSLLFGGRGDGMLFERDAVHLAEHLRPDREDEREAIVALHSTDRNADEIAALIQHAAAGDARVTVGQRGHEPIRRPLSNVAGAEDDALRVVVAKAADRLGEVVAVGSIHAQWRQIDGSVHLD